jgi:hypothetical protein
LYQGVEQGLRRAADEVGAGEVEAVAVLLGCELLGEDLAQPVERLAQVAAADGVVAAVEKGVQEFLLGHLARRREQAAEQLDTLAQP